MTDEAVFLYVFIIAFTSSIFVQLTCIFLMCVPSIVFSHFTVNKILLDHQQFILTTWCLPKLLLCLPGQILLTPGIEAPASHCQGPRLQSFCQSHA